jgi:hypothetical protein
MKSSLCCVFFSIDVVVAFFYVSNEFQSSKVKMKHKRRRKEEGERGDEKKAIETPAASMP